MTRSQLHAGLALGSTLLVAVAVSFVPAVPPASAQSEAERICERQGIGVSAAGYEHCLSQATRAVEWGEPEIAHMMARMTADARDACLAYGLSPTTVAYRACMERETYVRSLMVFSDEPQYDREIARP
jgi:hypothetical protein